MPKLAREVHLIDVRIIDQANSKKGIMYSIVRFANTHHPAQRLDLPSTVSKNQEPFMRDATKREIDRALKILAGGQFATQIIAFTDAPPPEDSSAQNKP